MMVPALLYKPDVAREKRLPAIIQIHGGPTSQSLNGWSPFVQYIVSMGIAILTPNYRGSTGYGRIFREANRFVMGDLDLSDCVSGRDYLVENSIADPQRIGLTGGSFGAYLTMCALAKYPEDEWACGSALAPFLNWFTEMVNEREDLQYWDKLNMGNPDREENRERIRNASPIFFIDAIRAPVQLIVGANDPRCPPMEEAKKATDQLMNRGVPVEFYCYADEGHGFKKLSNRIDAYKKITAFLEKHLESGH